ncbi:MAG TPA: hypothetical protein VJT80_06980, partial [Steroidobacteraceae bacterium]|nr:hypothetical protein [Steroidobacteraceae bacterium]
CKRIAAEMSGLGIRYDFGEGHPLLGRRMPDIDLVTANGPTSRCLRINSACARLFASSSVPSARRALRCASSSTFCARSAALGDMRIQRCLPLPQPGLLVLVLGLPGPDEGRRERLGELDIALAMRALDDRLR